jgi:hypothetical protein
MAVILAHPKACKVATDLQALMMIIICVVVNFAVHRPSYLSVHRPSYLVLLGSRHMTARSAIHVATPSANKK